MTAFVSLGVEMNAPTALILLPVAAIGHAAGLKVHDAILRNGQLFKQVVGGLLIIICLFGFGRL
jgi:hypothetical protein